MRHSCDGRRHETTLYPKAISSYSLAAAAGVRSINLREASIMSVEAFSSRLGILLLAATFTFGCVGGSKSDKKKSDVPVTMDTGPPSDTAAPPQDTGAPPQDSGTPQEVTNPPADANDPPADVFVPPQDVAVPPEDVAVPPQDVAVPPEDASSPEDVGVLPAGACMNEADQAIINSKDISGISKDCAIKNFGNAPAMTQCIQDGTGLSDGCVACFGGINSCGMSQCLFDCFDPDSKACDDCIAEKCAPAFKECSGLDPSAG